MVTHRSAVTLAATAPAESDMLFLCACPGVYLVSCVRSGERQMFVCKVSMWEGEVE